MNKYWYDIYSIRSVLMAAGLLAGLNFGLPAIAADSASAPVAHSDSVGATLTDTDVTAKVKLRLAGVKGLRGSDVDVTTTNGVVTLTGTATGSHAKAEAATLTKEVTGVKDVDNELKTPSRSKAAAETKSALVTTKHEVTDSWITTKVKSELLADSVTKGFDVKVVTTHGVVVLTGNLANHGAVDHVKAIVEKVDGVKSVDTAGLYISSK